jgi:hypothetical protein
MRRFLALGIALVALIGAGFVWTRDRPVAEASPPPPPPAVIEADAEDEPLVAPVANVTPATREARRFSRYDRDHDAKVSRDEYLAARKRAFAKLDANGDGRLGFDEYAVTTATRFRKADADADGVLGADEFKATAVKRSDARSCDCKDGG